MNEAPLLQPLCSSYLTPAHFFLFHDPERNLARDTGGGKRSFADLTEGDRWRLPEPNPEFYFQVYFASIDILPMQLLVSFMEIIN
ncbi:hypothetical protein TNCT_362931 [Trichonephila clavata]|uniref:Uncharacterized protein n=1 Tax=Trichonephila clavata TaxID=2740835 RepID=A0A8X6JAP7_TRICU|nr:hypothetical protein TNCT_362931 [Trichonephila clavata]